MGGAQVKDARSTVFGDLLAELKSAARWRNEQSVHVPCRNAMDRFIDGIELVAACFVGIVAADIFISVLLRYFFAVSIPDSYDFGKLLLGILIFWGIAATQLSRHAHHRRSGVGGGGTARQAADRYLRHAGAAVRGHACRPRCCSTRCG